MIGAIGFGYAWLALAGRLLGASLSPLSCYSGGTERSRTISPFRMTPAWVCQLMHSVRGEGKGAVSVAFLYRVIVSD